MIQAFEAGDYAIKTASGKLLKAGPLSPPQPVVLTGPWELTFPPNRGAPPSVTLDKLVWWPDHPDDGVKYFSGTATYRTSVAIPAAMLGDGKRLYLDLGDVKDVADVTFNGTRLGILWKEPFRVESPASPGPARTNWPWKSRTGGSIASSATSGSFPTTSAAHPSAWASGKGFK